MLAGKKVLVVMPAYNAAQTLERTYQDIPFDVVDEVLLVDDASHDETVEVGRVDSIVFDDKSFQAVVTLALESRYVFPKDSSLKILTSGLLGEQYLGIEPGADDKNLAPGDTISSTQSAVVLENLISQFLFSKAAEGSNVDASSMKK